MHRFLQIVSLLSLACLISCTPSVPLTKVIHEPIAVVDPTKPIQPDIENVHWQVWNQKVLKQNADASTNSAVYFVLSPKDFVTLIANLDGLIGYVQAQNNNVEYYRAAIAKFNEDQKVLFDNAPKEQPPEK